MTYPVRPKMYRPMDAAVTNDVATLQYDGMYIPAIFATPRRALAKLQEALKIKNQANIPLPFISVQRLAPVLDPLRYARVIHRKVEITDDCNAVSQLRRATPFSIDYQINFWDKKRYRLQDIVESYLSRYWPMHKIDVNYGPPYNSVPCHAAIVSIEDLSELEPGETADRMLRHNVHITLEGWSFEDTQRVPRVRNGIVCIVDDTDEENVQTLEGIQETV